MKTRRSHRIMGIVACGVLTLGAIHGQAASGQSSLKPPTIKETDEPPTIRMYLVTTLLAALVVGANLIPSKRGHQD